MIHSISCQKYRLSIQKMVFFLQKKFEVLGVTVLCQWKKSGSCVKGKYNLLCQNFWAFSHFFSQDFLLFNEPPPPEFTPHHPRLVPFFFFEVWIILKKLSITYLYVPFSSSVFSLNCLKWTSTLKIFIVFQLNRLCYNCLHSMIWTQLISLGQNVSIFIDKFSLFFTLFFCFIYLK